MNNWNYFQEKYGDPIGVGAQCQVYRQNDTVYKVLSVGHKICDVMREGYALALAEESDIPVSNIHGVYTEGGHIVMEMDYVAGESVTELIIQAAQKGDVAAIDAYVDDFVDLQIKLHSKPIVGLASTKQYYISAISSVPAFPSVLREKVLSILEELEDGTSLCHNDFHPLNVMSDHGKYTIIDWDSALIGDAAGDVAHSYVVNHLNNEELAGIYPGFAEKYLQKYLDKTQMDRKRVEAWIPVHAAILYVVLSFSAPKEAEKLLPFLPCEM
ncbi:MAG TPA: aminoglycoside phosphotransferase family protein [Lachnospiraceae bacterium]|nr:aminoglycoside phosphotransferase family protein [Lachnospiraceae bacterium]